jgi:hypothetical protein
MSTEQTEPILDARTENAVKELKGIISQKYPGASFELSRAEDAPDLIHLNTTVDLEDAGEVLDLVIDRVVELQADEGIPLHVIPIRTPERVRADLEVQRPQSAARRRSIPLFGPLP